MPKRLRTKSLNEILNGVAKDMTGLVIHDGSFYLPDQNKVYHEVTEREIKMAFIEKEGIRVYLKYANVFIEQFTILAKRKLLEFDIPVLAYRPCDALPIKKRINEERIESGLSELNGILNGIARDLIGLVFCKGQVYVPCPDSNLNEYREVTEGDIKAIFTKKEPSHIYFKYADVFFHQFSMLAKRQRFVFDIPAITLQMCIRDITSRRVFMDLQRDWYRCDHIPEFLATTTPMSANAVDIGALFSKTYGGRHFHMYGWDCTQMVIQACNLFTTIAVLGLRTLVAEYTVNARCTANHNVAYSYIFYNCICENGEEA